MGIGIKIKDKKEERAIGGGRVGDGLGEEKKIQLFTF